MIQIRVKNTTGFSHVWELYDAIGQIQLPNLHLDDGEISNFFGIEADGGGQGSLNWRVAEAGYQATNTAFIDDGATVDLY